MDLLLLMVNLFSIIPVFKTVIWWLWVSALSSIQVLKQGKWVSKSTMFNHQLNLQSLLLLQDPQQNINSSTFQCKLFLIINVLPVQEVQSFSRSFVWANVHMVSSLLLMLKAILNANNVIFKISWSLVLIKEAVFVQSADIWLHLQRYVMFVHSIALLVMGISA